MNRFGATTRPLKQLLVEVHYRSAILSDPLRDFVSEYKVRRVAGATAAADLESDDKDLE